jgi:hypothetical protein
MAHEHLARSAEGGAATQKAIDDGAVGHVSWQQPLSLEGRK